MLHPIKGVLISICFVSGGPSDHHSPGALSFRFVVRGPRTISRGGHFNLVCEYGALRPPGAGPPTTSKSCALANQRAGGYRKQPKVVHMPGAERLHLPVLRRGISKTVFSHLPVMSRSSGGAQQNTHSPARSLRTCQPGPSETVFSQVFVLLLYIRKTGKQSFGRDVLR